MPVDGKNPEKVTFTAEWERDPRAERQAAFNQFWHAYARGFYDANFHGRDWEGIRRRYEPLLEAVETPEEFAGLLHMMIGELECSHSEVTPAPGGPPAPVTPHLGFSLDYTHHGPGLRVREVRHEGRAADLRAVEEFRFDAQIFGERHRRISRLRGGAQYRVDVGELQPAVVERAHRRLRHEIDDARIGGDLPQVRFRDADDGDAASRKPAHCAPPSGANTG